MRNCTIAGEPPLFRIGMTGLRWVVPALLLLAGRSARAQSPADLPIAQALFEEGRTLMSAGRYDDACPKLSESQRLDPATGTLLNLAVCHERQGKTATAWAEYNDVAAASRTDGNAERQRIASQRIRELEPKLCRVSFSSAEPGAERDLVVKLDGVELGAAALGTAIPVDPGVHEVEVKAKGKKTWVGKVALSGEGASTVVALVAPETAGHTVASRDVADRPIRADSGQRRFAYVAGATGLMALGVGTYLGVRAKQEWDERNAYCPANHCEPGAQGASDRARTLALGADGAFALGLVSLGVAAYFAFASGPAPSAPAPRVAVSVTPDRAFVAWRAQF
jgi:hypothetical protein